MGVYDKIINTMARIISFSNQKGGVGKTTTCVNLAASLALRGKRILVVDFDAQCNASSALGEFDKQPENSVYDVLCSDLTAKEVIRKSEIATLDFIPSSCDLAGAELELSQIVIGRERVLQEKLAETEGDYDYVFIDCPPSLGLLTVNALTASDGVIIPIQTEYYALEGLSQMMNTIKLVKKFLNKDLEVDGVVLTMFDSRSKLSKGVLEEILKVFGDKVFDTKIPRNIRLAEAPSYGKPVLLYDKKCSGAIAYEALAGEFTAKIK